MKLLKPMMAIVAFALASGSATAGDLGSSRAQIEQEYSALPHDSNFDVVGPDGKAQRTPDDCEYYRYKNWVINVFYDETGHVNEIGYSWDAPGAMIDDDLRMIMQRAGVDNRVAKRAKIADFGGPTNINYTQKARVGDNIYIVIEYFGGSAASTTNDTPKYILFFTS